MDPVHANIACYALSGVLYFVAATISSVSTERSWNEYTVPDSLRFNINRSGYEQLTELHREYPQMFYSRQRYLKDSYEMCFDGMSNETWKDVFRKDVPKVQLVDTDYGTKWSQDPFCLTRQESNSRFIHPTSNNSNSSFQLQGQQLDNIQSDTVPAIRAVLITGVVLCFVLWVLLYSTPIPYVVCANQPGWMFCSAVILLSTTEALFITVVSKFIRLVAEEDNVTDPPYYGFVRNHEILRQTTKSTLGFNLVCASMALIGVGSLLLLVAFIVHVSRHRVQCCETRTVRAWRQRRTARAARRRQTRMNDGDGRSSAGTNDPVGSVSGRRGIQDSKDADEIMTVSATVAEPPIVTFRYLPDMLIA